MDDEQFRSAKAALDAPICAYEKALQHGYFSCQYAKATQIGERQALSCQHVPAHGRCQQFIASTFAVSGFAMGRRAMPVHLPFAQTMKVQVGGLLGLAALLDNDARDVANLLVVAETQAAEIDFSALMPAVSAFELPRRRGSGRKTE